MCCICVMYSAVDKSCSHVSTVLVPVIPDPHGDGHSKIPVHYTLTLASSLLLGFYIKVCELCLVPNSVCLSAPRSAACFGLPAVCSLLQAVFQSPLFHQPRTLLTTLLHLGCVVWGC